MAMVPFIHDRKQFSQSIGEFQLIRGKVADMYRCCKRARLLLDQRENLDMLGGEHVRRCAQGLHKRHPVVRQAGHQRWPVTACSFRRQRQLHQRIPRLGRLWHDAKLYERSGAAGTSKSPHADRPRSCSPSDESPSADEACQRLQAERVIATR